MPDHLLRLVVVAVAEELAEYRLPDDTVPLVVGVGPVTATLHLTAHLAAHHAAYRAVINLGVAGAIRSTLEVGQSILIVEERYIDIGREDGSPLALPSGASLVRDVAASAQLLTSTAAITTPRGIGLTSATVTTSEERTERLRRRYPDAATESMEGFAVFHVASLYRLPVIGVRGISNRVGERSKANWDLAGGIAASHRLLTEVLAWTNHAR